jgi:nucleoside permease NupC
VFRLFAWGLGRLWRDGTAPVPWRLVVGGLLPELVLALLFLDVPLAGRAFLVLNRRVDALQAASDQGTSLVFGYLGGGPPPFTRKTSMSWAFGARRWCWSSARSSACFSISAFASAR